MSLTIDFLQIQQPYNRKVEFELTVPEEMIGVCDIEKESDQDDAGQNRLYQD